MSTPGYFQPFQPLLSANAQKPLGLTVIESRPSNALGRLVHSFIQVRSAQPLVYATIPDALPTFFIGPKQTLCASFVSRVVELPIQAGVDYFGIRFRPGALKALFDVDLNLIGEKVVDALCLGNQNIGSLHHALYHFTSFEQRVAHCESVLGAIPTNGPTEKFADALAIIYSSQGNLGIGSCLAKTLQMSSRQLNRMFREYVGVSAKCFAAVVRAHGVCEYLYGMPKQSLVASSLYGYFDQAHLLNDFKQRFLLSPRPFFERFRSDFYNISET